MLATLFKTFAISARNTTIKTLPIIPVSARTLSTAKIPKEKNRFETCDCFNPNKRLTPKELKALMNTLEVLYKAINMKPLENNLNKYRWGPDEKFRMSLALKVLQKEPKEIKGKDLDTLANIVQTRTPQQCRSFLEYRIRIGMVSVSLLCLQIIYVEILTLTYYYLARICINIK